jgi:hypothetical protein
MNEIAQREPDLKTPNQRTAREKGSEPFSLVDE